MATSDYKIRCLNYFLINNNNLYKDRYDNLFKKYTYVKDLPIIKLNDNIQYVLMLQWIYLINYIRKYYMDSDYEYTNKELNFTNNKLLKYNDIIFIKNLNKILYDNPINEEFIDFLTNIDKILIDYDDLEKYNIIQPYIKEYNYINNEIHIVLDKIDSDISNKKQLVIDNCYSITKINYNEFYNFELKIEYNYGRDTYNRVFLQKRDIQTGNIKIYYPDNIIYKDITVDKLFPCDSKCSKELYMACINSNNPKECIDILKKKEFNKDLEKLWYNIEIQYKGLVALYILESLGIYIYENELGYSFYEKNDDNKYILILTTFDKKNNSYYNSSIVKELIIYEYLKLNKYTNKTIINFLDKILNFILQKLLYHTNDNSKNIDLIEFIKYKNILKNMINKIKKNKLYNKIIDRSKFEKLVNYNNDFKHIEQILTEKPIDMNYYNNPIINLTSNIDYKNLNIYNKIIRKLQKYNIS